MFCQQATKKGVDPSTLQLKDSFCIYDIFTSIIILLYILCLNLKEMRKMLLLLDSPMDSSGGICWHDDPNPLGKESRKRKKVGERRGRKKRGLVSLFDAYQPSWII